MVAGFTCIPNDVIYDTGLSHLAFRLYAVLKGHDNKKQGCFPGQEILSDELKTSQRSIVTGMNELVGAGLVRRIRRGRGNTNTYEFPTDVQSTSLQENYEVQSTSLHNQEVKPTSSLEVKPTSSLEVKPTSLPYEQDEVEQDEDLTRERNSLSKSLSLEILPVDITPSPPCSPPNYPDAFLAFWSAYPKGHGAKKVAFDEWLKLKPDHQTQSEILYGISKWSASERWTSGYIVDAERFLKRRMWEDDPPPNKPVQLHGRAADLKRQDDRWKAIIQGEAR